MGSTYSKVTLHFIFTVSGRENALTNELRNRVHRCITGIVENNDHKMLVVNSHFDHIHMLIGFNTRQSIGDLMRDIKSNSSRMINENRESNRKFSWQDGYAVISHSHSERGNVIDYIENQQEHHRKRSFREEVIMILDRFEIEYDMKYMWDEFWSPDEEVFRPSGA
jgi:putative transposase